MERYKAFGQTPFKYGRGKKATSQQSKPSQLERDAQVSHWQDERTREDEIEETVEYMNEVLRPLTRRNETT